MTWTTFIILAVFWISSGGFAVGRRKRLNPPPTKNWERQDYDMASFLLFFLGPIYVIWQTFHEMGARDEL